MSEWEPATEVEAALRDALRAEDQERYFQILARAELLLPISADALAGRVPMGWGTWTTSGRTHVLAFTSEAAMRICLADGAGSAHRVPFRELAAAWPNLEWWLAVNPGLSIEGYLPAWYVAQLSRGDVRLPGRTLARGRLEQVNGIVRARATVPTPSRFQTGESAPGPGTGSVSSASPASSTAPGLVTGGVPLARDGKSADRLATGPVEPISDANADGPPQSNGWLSAARVQVPAPDPTGSVPDPTGSVPDPGPATRVPAPELEPVPASVDPAAAQPVPADFLPANDLEQSLLNARLTRGTDSFLSKLLLATVLLPVPPGTPAGARPGESGFTWETTVLGDEPAVVVFTSPERLADHFSAPVPTIGVKFAKLIRRWPDSGWSCAVNPGTPVSVKLPGSQIVALASWATEVGLGGESEEIELRDARPAAANPSKTPDRPMMMQKTVVPAHVDYYLERGYDRVSGFVHRANEVAHLTTPTRLIEALGLDYPESPFRSDADEVHVLRWPVYRPNLYRIPYGGQTEAAMRAMEGWVIERPPFRGNGFARGDGGVIIAEFKVDSVRLPHGAQLWRIGADGSERLVATLDSDASAWRRAGED